MADRDKLLTQVGAKIRSLRENRGISQEALGEKAGLHRTYIGGVERGLRNASVKSLAKIAKALGVTVGQFFAGESD